MLCSGAHAEAAGRPDVLVSVLAAVAVAISVGVLTHVFGTGRRAWRVATWVPVVVALFVAFVGRIWGH